MYVCIYKSILYIYMDAKACTYLGSQFNVSKRKPCDVKDTVTMLNKSLGIPGEEKLSVGCGMDSIITEEL